MEQVTTGLQFNEIESKTYDKWSKKQIYDAYVIEYSARVMLNKEVNKLSRTLAEIKFLSGAR